MADFLQKNLLYRLSINEMKIIELLHLIYKECKKRELIRTFAATIDNELATVVIMLKSFDRWILLLSASNKTGRQNNSKSFILDCLIKERAGKPEILDFEGSNIPTIAMYNSGFGSLKTHYFSLKTINPNLFKFKKVVADVKRSVLDRRT
jgi:hypothetical protein